MSVQDERDQRTVCSILDGMYPLLRLHEAGGRGTHGGAINVHRAPRFPLALLEFRHRTKTMQARVVT